MEQYKATYMYQLTRKQSSWPKKNKKTQKKTRKQSSSSTLMMLGEVHLKRKGR